MCYVRASVAVHVHNTTGSGITTGGGGESDAVMQVVIIVVNGGSVTTGLDVTNHRTAVVEGVTAGIEIVADVTALDDATGHIGRSVAAGRAGTDNVCSRRYNAARIVAGCKRRSHSQQCGDEVEKLFHVI